MHSTALPFLNSIKSGSIRAKLNPALWLVIGVLVAPSTLHGASHDSLQASEHGDNGSNTAVMPKHQSAAGRYLEPGEVPLVAEEQGTAGPSHMVGNAGAGSFLISAASSGIVSLNQTTGAINFCVGYSYLNTGTPFGKCKKIGSISPAGLLGNARIDATSNYHAFVTNTSTGLVVECYLGFYTNNGEPFGKCISLQLQP